MNRQTIVVTQMLALIIFLLAGAAGATAVRGAEGGIEWMAYEEGRQRADSQNKKVFLVFNADWCRYCHQMEKETFQHPQIIAYVNRNFVPI
ncbi:MAG: thioredoxin family protein, partial [Desulfosarcina sp.]